MSDSPRLQPFRSSAAAVAIAALLAACPASKKKVEEPVEEKVTAAELLEQGIAAEEDGKLANAEKQYRRAIRLEPTGFDANKRLVDLLIRQARAPDAVEAAEAYGDANPDDPRAYHMQADAQIAAGDYPAADETLSLLLELEEKDATALSKRGRVRMLGKDIAAGEADFRNAVSLEPDNLDYVADLGWALIRLKQNTQAKAWLGKALAANEEHARANIWMGLIYRDELELDLALSHHLRAVRVAPEEPRAHFELGITQNLRGDNLAAEESLTTATRLQPGDPINWYALGEVRRILGKNTDAAAAYRKTLAQAPEHPKAANKLGVVLFAAGDIEGAEVVLTGAVRKNPDDPFPYFNLGMVYAQAEKYTLAINSLQRYLDLVPADDKDVPTAKRQIRVLTKKLRNR